jgi:type I restriction enzyme S subunit
MSTATTHFETENQLVPALRFKEFEGEWRETTLGNLFTFKNGLNSDKEKYGSGTKFINVLDIIDEDVITYNSIIGKVEVTEKELEKNEIIYGDVLFQRSSETREEVGQANIYVDENKSAVFGGFVIRGRKKEDYNPYFMNYLLKTSAVRKEITTKSGGSTRYNVGQASLSEVFVNLTDVPEQQKIASFLSAVDEKIQQLTKKKALLEDYKKGVMQKLFSGQLRFKDENGKAYPDWEEKRLGEVFKINAGGDVKKENAKKVRDDIFKYPIYANSEKRKGLYGYSDLYKVDFDCVTVTGRGALGVANARKEKFYPIVRLLVLKPKKKSDVIFFENLINQLNIFCESTGVPQLTGPQISTYKVKFPCLEEQQKIATYLSGIDAKIEAVTHQITQTQTFKKGLLQGMFV